MIRQNKNTKGIQVTDTENKNSQYVDDMNYFQKETETQLKKRF
jgi:hypothetical protein